MSLPLDCPAAIARFFDPSMFPPNLTSGVAVLYTAPAIVTGIITPSTFPELYAQAHCLLPHNAQIVFEAEIYVEDGLMLSCYAGVPTNALAARKVNP